ncbi:helix-turn-helix domain-containing protein [Roseiconus lacunae]|uniref:Helix-turn-helix domain-containing protein n=1 Tax=Roseiconus lacunae TaxID=2605694 RepID=A0ABT7PJN4_9BACT|nr:helix-turn-helix domain-containing protein [Roseiconus lacunae]MCD0459517.1 helix-turn-helix domain-containing protein [Roseiconus lacunae]MDM4016698.1 helix-turn-helix domain-containing protein [Roseiconus lacunae]WRQ50988.1 helix-turn-helix domain-containing protein [Stieleria sp. HD01]
MGSKRVQFSPKEVAQSLRVSESSVKRWCDKGAIPTIRTVGGHRRITLSALREFLRSSDRSLVDPLVLGIEEAELSLANPQTIVRPLIPGDGREPSQQEFRSALAVGDEDRCLRLLMDRLSLGWSRSEAAEDMITDAMRAIGNAWDCGDLDVYQERRSCTICHRLVGQLRDSLPPIETGASVAIGASPESDPYQLPTAMVELALRENGWNAINLGCNLPVASLIRAVEDYQPSLVWLSVTSVADAEGFIREENRLANALGENTSLIVGGSALDDELRPRLRYTAHCDSLRHLVELASVLRRQAPPSRN